MVAKKTNTTNWLRQPTGPGPWWYCGDDSNRGCIADFRCRGTLTVSYLDDDEDGKKQLAVGGIKCSVYKGIWHKSKSRT